MLKNLKNLTNSLNLALLANRKIIKLKYTFFNLKILLSLVNRNYINSFSVYEKNYDNLAIICKLDKFFRLKSNFNTQFFRKFYKKLSFNKNTLKKLNFYKKYYFLITSSLGILNNTKLLKFKLGGKPLFYILL